MSCSASATRLVHLPVAGDQRDAAHRAPAACSSASHAGQRALPSISSSVAPPPVERCVDAILRGRSAASAAAESPPPTTVVPGAAADGLGDRARAGRERRRARRRPSGRSRTPSRRRRSPRRKRAAVRGPMSRPIQPSGTSTPSSSRRVRVVGARRSPITRSTGSMQLARASRAGERERCARRLELLLLAQRGADRVTLGAQEREAHRAADQERVGELPGSARSRRSCRSTLAPPRIATSGRARVLEDRLQRRHLAFEQQPGGGSASRCATPSVDAWARWAEPNASLT